MDVVLGDRYAVFGSLGVDVLDDLAVVVYAGRLRLIDDRGPHLRVLDLDGDHLVRDQDGNRQDDQSEEATEIAFATFAAGNGAPAPPTPAGSIAEVGQRIPLYIRFTRT